MKKITVTVSGLSPFEMEVDYRPEKSELGNILRALSCATVKTSKEAVKIGEEIPVYILRETELFYHLTDCEPADTGKTVYEAVFELNDGKKILGYSDQDQPKANGEYYHCAATKDMKGRVIVVAKYVTNFRFTPL
ncbi:hypothetical protein L6R44_20960 [Enterobacter cloacae complex sp. ECC445]|uniref:hypothetical protein n=1 Tax=Enterobacter cloacae complex sp. ECC445 TaxID=2913213 RepID=UPI001F3A6A55|nr:hypothetical protein [Enterobacter cloacae complex sp. ECC445]MCG0458536.1 hypothetical protein [Enterobacter cloacae complex sp. ECC445]